jgi:hypothetical protein
MIGTPGAPLTAPNRQISSLDERLDRALNRADRWTQPGSVFRLAHRVMVGYVCQLGPMIVMIAELFAIQMCDHFANCLEIVRTDIEWNSSRVARSRSHCTESGLKWT